MAYTFSTALAGMTGTATRDIFRLLSRPEIISFAGGLPAGDCLPIAQIREITAEIFADPKEAARVLQYGQTEGYPGLRELLIPLIKEAGIGGLIDNENILILSGGGQGLDLMIKAFVNAGDVVLVENPTFLGFLETLKAYNGVSIGVKADRDGINLEDLEAKIKKYKPKLLYAIPNFSNPTGKTWPAERRKTVAALAAKYNFMVVEDDPYGRLRFSGDAVPSIKSFEKDLNGKDLHGPEEHVVYISSFSKTVSPGLRTGFAVGNAAVIRKLAIGKQGADLHTSNLSQAIIKRYLEKQYFYPNIEKSLPVYRERKTAMIGAIQKYMPGEFVHTNPDGGLFIWGEFSVPVNTVEIFKEAIEQNAAYINGTVFYADDGEGGKAGVLGANTLRLNYSNESPERIEKGVKALGEVFKKHITALGKK
ncbi:MAG: PLP-dependent aminotransferase family protein [Treponema sp.]|nr:PLP-dependent aminotransferase family protein [Treponema sp.]